jgi:hypothetical protein
MKLFQKAAELGNVDAFFIMEIVLKNNIQNDQMFSNKKIVLLRSRT